MATHQPTQDNTWQESNLCWAYDPISGCGFVTTSGVWVVEGWGLAQTAAMVPSDEGTIAFQRTRNRFPLVPTDRSPSRNGVAGLHWDELEPGHSRLTVDEPDCQIDVEFHDFYLAGGEREYDGIPAGDGHLEASGRVVGAVTVDGNRIEIDCLGHRDHSWGPRVNEPCRMMTWFSGSFGPELSFNVTDAIFDGGHAFRWAFIARHGVIEPVTAREVYVTFDWDHFSPVACVATVETSDGELLTFATVNDRNPTFYQHRAWRDSPGALAAADTLVRVRCGALEGVADIETLTNHCNGRDEPVLLARTPLTDGLWTARTLPTAEAGGCVA